MKYRLPILSVFAAACVAVASPASAHEYRHHHGGGPIGGLVRAVVEVATLPVRVAGGVVEAVAPPYPVYAQRVYAQPVYSQPVYSQPVYYAAPPAYAYPQPVYAYPPQAYGYP